MLLYAHTMHTLQRGSMMSTHSCHQPQGKRLFHGNREGITPRGRPLIGCAAVQSLIGLQRDDLDYLFATSECLKNNTPVNTEVLWGGAERSHPQDTL